MTQRVTLSRADAVRLAIEQAELATAELIASGVIAEDAAQDPTQRLKLTSALTASHVRIFGRQGVLSTEDLEKIAVNEVCRRHGVEAAPESDPMAAAEEVPAAGLALPDLEPLMLSEVGTKLDLARAYMDMGDPDGARNILEEVLSEGSAAQKQEAQRLMESLPG